MIAPACAVAQDGCRVFVSVEVLFFGLVWYRLHFDALLSVGVIAVCFLYYIGCDIVCRAVSFLSAGDVLLSVGDTLFPFGDMVRSRLGVIFIRQVFSVVGSSFRRMQRGKRIGGRTACHIWPKEQRVRPQVCNGRLAKNM